MISELFRRGSWFCPLAHRSCTFGLRSPSLSRCFFFSFDTPLWRCQCPCCRANRSRNSLEGACCLVVFFSRYSCKGPYSSACFALPQLTRKSALGIRLREYLCFASCVFRTRCLAPRSPFLSVFLHLLVTAGDSDKLLQYSSLRDWFAADLARRDDLVFWNERGVSYSWE